ncbi:MAG TPA: sialidase family protein, partial [Actinomycetota bacterium]
QFFKSDDLGATFRKPQQVPVHGLEVAASGGGGDSHQVVGHATHKVFFTDLPADCVNVNTSRDLGETFTADQLGCGVNFGLDDRQWIEEDETFGPTACPPAAPSSLDCGNVYISFINFAVPTPATPTLSLARSQHGAANGSFGLDSVCNTFTTPAPLTGAADNAPTPCPDPADPLLQIAGPVVADKEGTATRPPTHALYIPFIRSPALIPAVAAGPPYQLYVARSLDGGDTWTRHLVAELGQHNPMNIFPRLAIDRGGNLYYTWSQTQGPVSDPTGFIGEQDVYYAFSTNGGEAWSSPINLTKEAHDSAVFPWMVAGDPGRVDLVLYKANTGINSQIAAIDAEGPCQEPGLVNPTPPNECNGETTPNPSVWNVYFSQSLNALNTGPNFKAVQVSAAPNHIGQICTLGLVCEGDRSLLDFFTVDVDHRGAAVIAYSDTMNGDLSSISRDRNTRQLSGVSVYKNETITLQNTWPLRDHTAFDRAGDVFDTGGLPKGSCPGMDVLKTTANRNNGNLVTITLTLNGPPSAGAATACGDEFTTGGVWGAVFWARSSTDQPGHTFYIAYRDDPSEPAHVEGGVMDNFNVAVTSLDFQHRVDGTLGGTCLPQSGPPATGTCTIAMTVDVTELGITPGNALLSVTGLSAYFFGLNDQAPLTRVLLGNSEQADSVAAFHVLGSGTI